MPPPGGNHNPAEISVCPARIPSEIALILERGHDEHPIGTCDRGTFDALDTQNASGLARRHTSTDPGAGDRKPGSREVLSLRSLATEFTESPDSAAFGAEQ